MTQSNGIGICFEFESLLKQGNNDFLNGEFTSAYKKYLKLIIENPEICNIIKFNISKCRLEIESKKNSELSVGVSGWDLGRNPAGRAHVLMQLYSKFTNPTLIGFLDLNSGCHIWPPIKELYDDTNLIKIQNWSQCVHQIMNFVVDRQFNLIHISKPRAPNIILAIFYKLFWNSKIIIDIDDEEMTFFCDNIEYDEMSYSHPDNNLPDLNLIWGREWTKYSISLVDQFDGLTVSNDQLQNKYGGIVIPHSRSSELFDPCKYSRDIERKKLNIETNSVVVVFIGTPRSHKGLIQAATAISKLNNNSIVFLIVGNFLNKSIELNLKSIPNVNFKFLNPICINEVPRLLVCSDLCIMPLDTESVISLYQMPAKITDMLAMGVLVLTNKTKPLIKLINNKILIEINGDLSTCLRSILIDFNNYKSYIDNGRAYFEKHLSNESVSLYLKNYVYECTNKDILDDKSKTYFLKLFETKTANQYKTIFQILNNPIKSIVYG